MVMNNYFNMPIGAFNTTTVLSGSNSTGQPGYKFNFYPQNTLAKSRITRRQMSMSRKIPNRQKLSSTSNIQASGTVDDVNDYSSQTPVAETANKNHQRKNPLVPKLNIG